MRRSLRRLGLRALGVGMLAGASTLGLFGVTGPSPAGATSTNGADIIWGLFGSGPYTCSMYVGHEPAYGGALAWSWTPDPFYGGQGCWSSYSIIYSTATAAISGGGNPSSAVVVPGLPSASAHLGCFGLFDCASSWFYLP